MKSSRKKDFMEDSFRKPKPEPFEQAPPRPLIRPKLITSGFEDIGDYCAKNPTISELQKLPRSVSNPLDLSNRTPSPNHLRVEIRFYNDTLLVISILMEMYQALIEEMKLPSSK